MRITFPFAGRVIERCQGGRDILQPLLMENICSASGPRCLEDCRILGLRLGGRSIPVETSPRILTTTFVFREADGAALGGTPEGSPAQEGRRLPLLIRVLRWEALEVPLPRSVELELGLVFTDGATRHLLASGVYLVGGVLNLRSRPRLLAAGGPARQGMRPSGPAASAG